MKWLVLGRVRNSPTQMLRFLQRLYCHNSEFKEWTMQCSALSDYLFLGLHGALLTNDVDVWDPSISLYTKVNVKVS